MSSLRIAIGATVFCARLRAELAPQSCARLRSMLPYCGEALHARWSGEALWSPLARVWASTSVLPQEHATANPQPGECLLFGGPHSEPELLIAYGTSRFASSVGLLEGNPVLVIDEGLSELAQCGRDILRRGVMELRIG